MLAVTPVNAVLRLLILLMAGAAVWWWARRWSGGSVLSHLTILGGVALLMVGDALRLGILVHPGWLGFSQPEDCRLPFHSCGYLLVLVGFLALVYEFGRSKATASEDLSAERTRAEAARLREAQLRAVLNCATEYCIITADLAGEVTSYTAGGARFLGYEPDEVIGKFHVSRFHAPGTCPGLADVRKVIEKDGYFERETVFVRKDGEAFPALLTVTPLVGERGTTTGFLAIAKDITSLKQAEQALRSERDFIRGVVETSELFIVGVSVGDGRITMFNRGAERISGYRSEEVIGRVYADLLLPSDVRDEVVERIKRMLGNPEEGIGRGENPILTNDGEQRIVSWTNSLSFDRDGRPTHLVAFGYDVTEQKSFERTLEQAKADLTRANAELSRLARTDDLTGLANRRQGEALFERELARSHRNQTPLAVVMMDLDHFKSVNDSYGHDGGDAVLRHVASVLRGRLRATDIVSRYGGDEFLLALPESDLEDAVAVAGMVLEALGGQAVRFGEVEISLSASLGVAVLRPGQNVPASELVRMADQALYAAKRQGGGHVVGWDDLQHGEAKAGLEASDPVRRLRQEVSRIAENTHEGYLDGLYRIVKAVEARRAYTAGHSQRVARYGVAIGRRMGLGPADVETVYRAGMLHDLGRVVVPDEVLWKDAPLTKEDWNLVCQHPLATVKILGKLEFLRRVLSIIRHHHERPDGRGYPDGQAGNAIPLEARILAVADALDAMTCERPYRRAMALQEALDQLREGSGAMFDGRVVEAAVAEAAESDDWPLVKIIPAEAVSPVTATG